MSAKASVREKFSLEFVTGGAESEVKELKNLFSSIALPALELFDEESIAAVKEVENVEADEDVDPVTELRMLFGRVA